MHNTLPLRLAVAGALLACLTPPHATAADAGPVETEIRKVRKELAQVKTERERNAAEMKNEKRGDAEYDERTAARRARVNRETDSLKSEAAASGRRLDSLSAVLGVLQSQQRQIDLGHEDVRRSLVEACERAATALDGLPPMVHGQTANALGLLKSELAARSVDVVEGLSRLHQILAQAEEAYAGIQVVQESSPVPDIRGTVYRLRIGGFFEAVCDIKGEQGAVWKGVSGEGTAVWERVSSQVASQILRAVNIREGKALPDFAELPVGRSGAADGGGR